MKSDAFLKFSEYYLTQSGTLFPAYSLIQKIESKASNSQSVT